jgi:hypothetical protein
MARKKISLFGTLLVLGGGAAFVALVIMLGESDIGWLIP